jgi:ribosomal-protein-alanine N-acetyltransferase
MSEYIIETTRCRLREMRPNDAYDVFRLNQHPDVYRFTTDAPFASEDEAKKFIESYNAYRKYGYGRWAVELKSNRNFIGWCGLKFHPEENEVDVGYRLLPEFWGNGFAPETGTACIEYGFDNGLKRIVARIHKENIRSIKVVAKMGMTYEKDLIYDGVPWLNYVKLKNPI